MEKEFIDASHSNSTDWKKLAISRRLVNKELNKRLVETKAGREKWKLKAQTHKIRANKLQRELELIKKKLGKILV